MSFFDWAVWVLVGKLLMFVFRRFPLAQWLSKNETMEELISCDLCFGVWAYSILFLMFRQDLFSNHIPYLPVVSEFMGGIVTSFVAYLITHGWKANFEVIQVNAIHKG